MNKSLHETERYYYNKLKLFVSLKKGERLAIKNNELTIAYDEDECNFLRLIVNLFRINNDQLVDVLIKDLFSEYLKFIDRIITLLKRNDFYDNYLIVLSRVQIFIIDLIQGLHVLSQTYDHKLKAVKCVIFSFFDFLIIFNQIKKKYYIENGNNQYYNNENSMDLELLQIDEVCNEKNWEKNTMLKKRTNSF
jgi:hypothetical protein